MFLEPHVAKEWEDINSRLQIIDEFPFPIAHSYKRINDPDTPSATWCAVHTFVLTLRYLTLLLLADFMRKPEKVIETVTDSKILKEIEEAKLFILSHVPIPEGNWRRIFSALLRIYGSCPKHLFVSEFHSLSWRRIGDQVVSIKSPPIEKHLELFTSIRNHRLGHGGMPTVREENEKLPRILFLLGELLETVSFLRDYPLVYLEKIDGKQIFARKCMGGKLPQEQKQTTIKVPGAPSDAKAFYLMQPSRQFLRLSPFLINHDQPGLRDLLFLQEFPSKKGSATYLPTYFDSEIVSKKNQHLIDALERFRREFEKSLVTNFTASSWPQLKRCLSSVNKQEIDEIGEKYNKETYLERADLYGQYHRFCESEKKFFVIVGNSGTGKSAFLARLGIQAHEDPDVATFSINGAKDDLSNGFLNLLERKGAEQSVEFWRNILNRHRSKQGKQLLVVLIDAINENHDPDKLFKSIFDSVREFPLNHDSVKLVLTSRVHSWDRMLRKNDHLPAGWFYVPGENLGNTDLRAFEVRGFEKETERRRVYELYRKHRNIKTKFEELSREVQTLIEDPLFLSLLTSSYEGENLPAEFSAAEVYSTNESKLKRTRKLDESDLDFLSWVVELFWIHGKGKLELDVLKETETTDTVSPRRLADWLILDSTEDLPRSVRLWQFFLDPDFCRRFKRLTACAILKEEYDADYNFSVRFLYERLHDHYVGNHVFNGLPKAPEPRIEKYVEIAQRIRSGFLSCRGPLEVALGLELRNEGSELLIGLASCGDVEIRNALIATLDAYPSRWTDGRQRVNEFLDILVERYGFGATEQVKMPKQPPICVAERPRSDEERRLMAAQILNEVSGRLDRPDVIVHLMTDKGKEVRADAIRHSFEVCERTYENDSSTDIHQRYLNALCEKIIAREKWGLPPSYLLATALEFTGMLLIEHTRDAGLLDRLWQTWRGRILNRYLYPDRGDGAVRRVTKTATRFLGRAAIKKMVLQRIRKASPNVSTNYREFASFFEREVEVPLTKDDRSFVGKLVPYMDPDNTSFTGNGVGTLFHEALRRRDSLLGTIAFGAARVHGARDPGVLIEHLLPEFKRSCEETIVAEAEPGSEFPIGSLRRNGYIQTFCLACDKYIARTHQANPDKEIPDEWIDVLGEMAKTALQIDRGLVRSRVGEYYKSISDQTNESLYTYGGFPLHWYASLYTSKHKDVGVIPLFEEMVKKSLSERDIYRLRSLVGSLGVFRANLKCYRGLLNGIKPLLIGCEYRDLKIPVSLRTKCHCKRFEENRKAVSHEGCVLHDCVISNLGKLRSKRPHLIDSFLDECKVDSETRKRVRAAQRIRSAGAVFARVDQFVLDALDDIPAVRKEIMAYYRMAEDSRTLERWIDKAISYLMDRIGQACAGRENV